jgi:hypothetical protein
MQTQQMQQYVRKSHTKMKMSKKLTHPSPVRSGSLWKYGFSEPTQHASSGLMGFWQTNAELPLPVGSMIDSTTASGTGIGRR